MLLAIKHCKDDGEPIELTDNLFIGSIGAAYNKSRLHELGISNILTVADNISPMFPDEF
jgi:hypothetical protein